jgi:Tfp pilus assembly protein PilE
MAAAADPAFELLRFAVVASSAEATLLEVEGRFAGGDEPAVPAVRLVAEDPAGDRQELPAMAAGPAGPAGWRATFAVPLAALPGAGFALAFGRLLVELPAPDLPNGEVERLARLAREANALRRRVEAAEAAAEGALATLAEAAALRSERDDLRAALAEAAEAAEREHAEAAERVTAAELRSSASADEAERTREQLIAVETDLARERAELDALREEAATARSALDQARAELEALEDEQGATTVMRPPAVALPIDETEDEDETQVFEAPRGEDADDFDTGDLDDELPPGESMFVPTRRSRTPPRAAPLEMRAAAATPAVTRWIVAGLLIVGVVAFVAILVGLFA